MFYNWVILDLLPNRLFNNKCVYFLCSFKFFHSFLSIIKRQPSIPLKLVTIDYCPYLKNIPFPSYFFNFSLVILIKISDLQWKKHLSNVDIYIYIFALLLILCHLKCVKLRKKINLRNCCWNSPYFFCFSRSLRKFIY